MVIDPSSRSDSRLFVIILHSAACGYGIYLTYFLPASSNNKNESNVASPIIPQQKKPPALILVVLLVMLSIPGVSSGCKVQ